MKNNSLADARLFLLYQEAEQRDCDYAEQGGKQGAVGSDFLPAVVDLGQVQQDAGAGRRGDDQDAAPEHRIQSEGKGQRPAEQGEDQQLSGGDQPDQGVVKSFFGSMVARRMPRINMHSGVDMAPRVRNPPRRSSGSQVLARNW